MQAEFSPLCFVSARITTMVEEEKETRWEARERRCAPNVAFRLMFLYPQKKTGQRALICTGLLGCSIPPSGTWWVPTTRVQCVHWSICTNTCRPSSTWGCTTLSFIAPQGRCSLGSQWADKHGAEGEGEGEGKYILGGESGCCFFHKLCWGGVRCSEEKKRGGDGADFDEWTPAMILCCHIGCIMVAASVFVSQFFLMVHSHYPIHAMPKACLTPKVQFACPADFLSPGRSWKGGFRHGTVAQAQALLCNMHMRYNWHNHSSLQSFNGNGGKKVRCRGWMFTQDLLRCKYTEAAE